MPAGGMAVAAMRGIDNIPMGNAPGESEPICLQRFGRLCADACQRGWHEANGGNLSYRLDAADVASFGSALVDGGEWHALGNPVPELSGERFLMSASGAYLSNVIHGVSRCCGVIELDESGNAWRRCWGFDDDARPSSELETHLAIYVAALQAGDGADRIVYHAHCPNVIALSTLLDPDARVWTRTLWRCMTEGIIVFPRGIGVVPWMVPGGSELAQATRELMTRHGACIWTQHGAIARAASFDTAFGTIDTIEKSAGIYLRARAANGGNEPSHLVSDDQLRAICVRYGLHPDDDFLE